MADDVITVDEDGELFFVRLVRDLPDAPSPVVYEATVRIRSSGDALVAVGDRVRSNDLRQITLRWGQHVPVLAGEPAGICDAEARLLKE